MKGLLDDVQRQEIGREVMKRKLAKGMTYSKISELSGWDEGCVSNVIKGIPTKLDTLKSICKAVDLDISSFLEAKSDKISDDQHGSYTRASLEKVCGDYIGYRWCSAHPSRVLRSRVSVSWPSGRGSCLFEEVQDDGSGAAWDHCGDVQEGGSNGLVLRGEIYVGQNGGFIQVMTMAQGWLRLISLTHPQPPSMEMLGVVLTQTWQGVSPQPVVSPFVLYKPRANRPEVQADAAPGLVALDSSEYEVASTLLGRAERYFVASCFRHDTALA
ncbi:helix-turn-helix domain-containing protein [Paracraurococcus lichenis]|uniref:Helix-turn-helix transcriptional regulator n=1 Tax=Paracraurococcus lichenis TaxID=3064888 RepID=A0ABT9ECE7_9PROT|nr:helix-turn-helix transcriptional regulator [Paracraurococcus sp. LOR1-02]MDO9713883.1 helix-turn-helix transcriptional regulator [Paracraurococcus sp. LOR1-02]